MVINMPLEEKDVRRMIREELSEDVSRANTNNGVKKERKKSKWQVYLKDCIPKQNKELGIGEKVKACSVEYKKDKDKIVIQETEEQLTEELTINEK